MLALSRALRDEYNIAAVTNDIFTRYPSLTPSKPLNPIKEKTANKETEKTPNS